ncbi:hypothetical protein ILUMI_23754 [Ignelater luminosus]|uniref:Uracil-DNA glycosylase-like domain-containing protein n=1 Tax=Ignelater luminosus TaxID=2038154 RepID=A0A8K0FWT5_IGNLU|nr:hypothetical protein ILUMI_23754 [Ignelater luminosus]
MIFGRTLRNMLRKKLKLDPIGSAKCIAATQHNSETNNDVTHDNHKPNDGHLSEQSNSSIAEQLLKLELDLNESLKKLIFKKPVEYVYYPLEYAFKPHSAFVKKYCKTPKKILFLGMNPGPWGMCQTGIPFGEVKIVKEWFEIDEEVFKPEQECPEREVLGLACPRSEVSGQRIWGLFRNICGTPENFFKSSFMFNYCPIAMLKGNGGNITPSEIKGETQRQLEEICDETLFDVIQLLQVEILVGVGKFAEKRALEVLKRNNPLNTKVLYLVHPSPRVANNQNWMVTAEKKLTEFNLMSYFKN